MFKQLLGAALLALSAATAWAGVEVNKADEAMLDSVKGIGPAMSGKLIAERKKAPYKSWGDLIERVPGIGPGNAARLSGAGLTVNDQPYAAAGPVAKPTATPAPAKGTKTGSTAQ